MKQQMLILLSLLLLSGSTVAQPGWVDFTARYFYTILDKNGKEISFKHNKHYSIMIDTVLYHYAGIPNDSLKPAKINYNDKKGFENQIRINDCSLVNYQNDFLKHNKRLVIKIIHKQDTMFICQPSGMGSNNYHVTFKQNNSTQSLTDYTLQFVAGRLYFPQWIKDMAHDLPETSGQMQLINSANIEQPYFIVSKNSYDSFVFKQYNANDWQNIDDYVVQNYFLKGHFKVEKRIEPTTFKQLPISHSWLSTIYSTKDQNLYWAMIDYSGSTFKRKNTFAVLNKQENSISLFLPKDDPKLFDCETPYINTFDTIMYLPVFFYKNGNDEVYKKQSALKKVYRSVDEGNTWQEDEAATQIFAQFNLFDRYQADKRKIEFIDKNHAVVYYKHVLERNEEKNTLQQQGIYYLIKDMAVIDSFKSPDNTHFYGHYGNALLSITDSNTVPLGIWTLDKDKKDFKLSLQKINGKWRFKVTDNIHNAMKSPAPNTENDLIVAYKHFQLVNKQELIFKNGMAKLKLKYKLNNHSDYIIEQGNQIYIISSRFAYISFDAGTSWYLYPAPLLQYHYQLISINAQNEIYYFNNKWLDESGSQTSKIIHQFSLK